MRNTGKTIQHAYLHVIVKPVERAGGAPAVIRDGGDQLLLASYGDATPVLGG
jgi:hypothetical protein